MIDWSTLVSVVVGGLIGLSSGLIGPLVLENRKQTGERKRRRAEKFEELVAAVVEHYHWIRAIRYSIISGEGSQPSGSPLVKIEAITIMYFPEFELLVQQFDGASNKYEIWISLNA